MLNAEMVAIRRLSNKSIAGLLALLIAAVALVPAAWAQQIAAPPQAELIDANGVKLQSPHIQIAEPSLSIGPASEGGLQFERTRPLAHLIGPSGGDPILNWFGSNLSGYVTIPNSILDPQFISAAFGGSSAVFASAIDGVTPVGASRAVDGSKLELIAGKYILTTSDGTRVTYDTAYTCSTGYLGADSTNMFMLYGQSILNGAKFGAWVTKVEKPDGEVINWHYVEILSSAINDPCGAKGQRLQSVTNNLGYMIHFKYKSDTAATHDDYNNWATVEKVTGINTTVYACSPTASSCDENGGAVSWPTLTYGEDLQSGGTVYTVADRLGNTTRYNYTRVVNTYIDSLGLTSVASPANPASDISFTRTFTLGGTPSGSLTLTNSAGTWTYTYGVNSGTQTTVSGPGGYSRTMTIATSANSLPYVSQDTVNGYQMSYAYDNTLGRLTQITYPDGRFTALTYDARRNVTQVRQVAKPGSGLTDIYQYASYPETGATICVNAKTCNKPDWVTVAGLASGTPASLPKTDYAYLSTHGVLLTETSPAPGSGPYAAIRPQTRYTYGDAGTGIVRPTAISTCRTTASCAGTADETVVATTYNAKRVPQIVTARAGDWVVSSTTTTTYTPQGDVESVDGPLSGTADTAWTFYDTMRRPRVTVSPDPDGAGALIYRAMRTTYDTDGQPTVVEQGSVATPANCSAANNFCASTMTVLAKSTFAYDSYGRTVRENAINASTSAIEAVTQTSYNVAGRVACIAQRMNPAAYGSLPDPTQIQPLTNPTGGACAQSATGSFGQDQITHMAYTANGDPLVVKTGYSTTLVRIEQSFTYLAPGQVGTLKDAANNLTTYEYDGFNRLKKLRYPVTTLGGNVSSTTNYEEYGYDAAGNRTSERRRDGLMIANTYDVLGRLRVIDKPGAELDVTNSYDNFSNLISASQTGSSVTWAYDALGRVTSEAQGLGTVSYAYDTAGRRTQLTYPGSGFYVNYQYFDDGGLKLIGLNGATTGTGVQATYFDDQLGRRASMCRGPGNPTSCSSVARTVYSYDAISRMTNLSHDLITGGSANDASWTLAYSPASQLTSRTAASAVYEWGYGATFTDAYAVNGLNQYTAVAGQGLTYDGRGNTTNDTTKTYTYDSSNMLTGSPTNGATLAYDPTGRLLSVTLSGVTTKFLYDGTQIIAEYNGSNALLRRYIHGDGMDDPIVWYDSAGTTFKRDLFKDERGSVIAADTGSMVTTVKYDEYGTASSTGPNSPRFKYTGQAWLPELGLYYYKARIYNADLGRFMQTDPIGTADQMNLYAYVGNDPFNRTDPFGLFGADVEIDNLPIVTVHDLVTVTADNSFRCDVYDCSGLLTDITNGAILVQLREDQAGGVQLQQPPDLPAKPEDRPRPLVIPPLNSTRSPGTKVWGPFNKMGTNTFIIRLQQYQRAGYTTYVIRNGVPVRGELNSMDIADAMSTNSDDEWFVYVNDAFRTITFEHGCVCY